MSFKIPIAVSCFSLGMATGILLMSPSFGNLFSHIGSPTIGNSDSGIEHLLPPDKLPGRLTERLKEFARADKSTRERIIAEVHRSDLECFAVLRNFEPFLETNSYLVTAKPDISGEEFNTILANSEERAMNLLRNLTQGTWEQRRTAFALMSKLNESPGLAKALLGNFDIVQSSLDPSLLIRILAGSKQVDYDELRSFAEGLKSDIHKDQFEYGLVSRGWREGKVSNADYVTHDLNLSVRWARIKEIIQSGVVSGSDEIGKLAEIVQGTKYQKEFLDILQIKGY